MAYVVTASWRAKEGCAAEIAAILERHAMATRQEEGVITFIAHQSSSDDHEFMLYEQFVNEAAFLAHQLTNHFRENVTEKAMPLLEKRERQYFHIIRI